MKNLEAMIKRQQNFSQLADEVMSLLGVEHWEESSAHLGARTMTITFNEAGVHRLRQALSDYEGDILVKKETEL